MGKEAGGSTGRDTDGVGYLRAEDSSGTRTGNVAKDAGAVASAAKLDVVAYVMEAWYDGDGSAAAGKAVEPPVGAVPGAVPVTVGNAGYETGPIALLWRNGTARAAVAIVRTVRKCILIACLGIVSSECRLCNGTSKLTKQLDRPTS